MKILNKNLKKGKIKIITENLDDLWYLSQIIEPGDIIEGSTTRKIVFGDSSEKSRAERKRVFLSIVVEKIDYEDINVLKAIGKINSENKDIGKGSYHSFDIDTETKISIIKNWPSYQLKLLNDATKTNIAKIMVCVLDRENAVFAKLKKQGFEVLSEIKGDVQKKEERANKSPQNKKGFYNEIYEKMKDYDERYNFDYIVVASPAFFKEDFVKIVKNQKIKDKIRLSGCSSVSKNAINEVLKREELANVIKDDKTSKEVKLVEKLMEEISKDNKAAYGLNDVSKAVEMGAIQELLITDSFINEKREKGNFQKIDRLMKKAENLKADIHIISKENEGGKKLEGLGGIAAILRFKI
jgi:protein pelota